MNHRKKNGNCLDIFYYLRETINKNGRNKKHGETGKLIMESEGKIMLNEWNPMEQPSEQELKERLKEAREKLEKQQLLIKEQKE